MKTYATIAYFYLHCSPTCRLISSMPFHKLLAKDKYSTHILDGLCVCVWLETKFTSLSSKDITHWDLECPELVWRDGNVTFHGKGINLPKLCVEITNYLDIALFGKLASACVDIYSFAEVRNNGSLVQWLGYGQLLGPQITLHEACGACYCVIVKTI